MSRRIANLAFAAALGLTVTVGLSGVAWAGPPTVCGDGQTDPPEQCDDSNQTSGDGCSFPSCLPEVCGDTIVNPDPGWTPGEEECDDGNTDPGDGCDANCKLECGNGTIEGAETCDDSGESATCDDDCTAVACGDDNVNEAAGEQCEPPNTATCDAQCQDLGPIEPLTKQQQACVNGINKNALGVVKSANKGAGKCLKNVASGKEADLAACLAGVDNSKATGKTTNTNTKKCGAPTPPFGYTDPTTVNTAATDASANAFATIFGATPTVADKKAEKDRAKCQADVAKRAFKLQETWLSEANKAKKKAIKGSKSTAAATTDDELAAAIDAGVAASNKVANAEAKLNTSLSKKCLEADVDPAFDCNGATTTNELTLCIREEAKRQACLALEAADGLALACPGDA